MKYIRRRLNEAADPTLGGISYTVQGTPGYTYSILPLTHNLEQRPNKVTDDYYIYPGCMVRGVGVNNQEKHFTGQVMRIIKDSDGAVKYLVIKTVKTNRFVTILADKNLKLILHNKPSKREVNTPFTMSISHNMKI